MNKFIQKYGLYIAWAISLLAVLGSLYYSNVMNLPPCILCWYQRIVMYPLVIILGVGILRKDVKVWITALPLTVIGLFIAVYHNLLYYKLLPEALTPCVTGISCTTKLIELFGFLTIPLQALIAFVILTVVLIAYARGQRNE